MREDKLPFPSCPISRGLVTELQPITNANTAVKHYDNVYTAGLDSEFTLFFQGDF